MKTRGTWGEVQLEALLEQMLTPEQYAKNVATVPKSSERVEFAIRLPGREAGTRDAPPVWLPIDAKFPREDYERLIDAQERADAVAVEKRPARSRHACGWRRARSPSMSRRRTRPISRCCSCRPRAYAEILRRPGLTDLLQRDYRVTVAGPTTLTALLNSLQMGFRTLAIEQRSSEVWQVLGAVKTEFGKFGDVLARTKSQLETVTRSIEAAEQRTRVMNRKLKQVEALPGDTAAGLLGAEGPTVPMRTTHDAHGRHRLESKTAPRRRFLTRWPARPARGQCPASVSSASPVTRTMRQSGSTVAPIFS